MKSRVAFIGTGIMGGPMAGHLLAAGHPLVINTRTKSRAHALLDQGAIWAATPAAAAREADFIFVCVPDTPDVEAVAAGAAGILSAARPGMIVVDHSTISPTVTRLLSARFVEAGTHWVDAPVSGGDIGARNATLAIMAGGPRSAFDKVLPLLQHMGKTITYCGESGTGQLTKLANQIFVSLTNLAICEGLVFSKAVGLDPLTTIQAVAAGAAGSWQLSNLGPRMVAGDFKPGFMIDLQQKDLRLVLEAASGAGMKPDAVNLVHRLFAEAQSQGRGREGTQALIGAVEAVEMIHSNKSAG